MDDIPGWMEEHEARDVERFDQQSALISTLATKEDVKEVLEFMKTVKVGIGVFEFSFDNAGKIGTFLIFLLAIYISIRYGLAGLFTWLSTTKLL